LQLSARNITDMLRSIGGLLFAVGAAVLFVRKSGHHGWSDLALLLVVLVPATVLYVLALDLGERPRSEGAQPWRSVLLVAAILLGPVAFFAFLDWIGASTRHLLYDAGVFALTGLLAGYAARRARVPYAALLGALALLVAWLFVWGKLLDHPSANTYRWLLVAGAALLLLASARLVRAGAIGGGEVATAGGLTAVAAGVLGVIIGSFLGVFHSFVTVGESSSATASSSGVVRSTSTPLHIHTSGMQSAGWDVYLLIVSVGLVWVGSRARVRGLGYAGGIGLLAFVISAGAQITRLEVGRSPTAGIVGWPLALLIIGVAGLAAPALYSRKS
jgi:hypothetical protein